MDGIPVSLIVYVVSRIATNSNQILGVQTSKEQ